MKPKPPSVFTKEARARISRTDRDEVERRVEAFLKGVAQALPARRIVRAIRLDATETDLRSTISLTTLMLARPPRSANSWNSWTSRAGSTPA